MKNHLILLAIIISAVIIGGSILGAQYMKQQSIEKQKSWELEQEKKEYIAKRKMECMEIEAKERKQWNNISDHEYLEDTDECKISYTTDRDEGVDCAEKYGGKTFSSRLLSDMFWGCMKGVFYKYY